MNLLEIYKKKNEDKKWFIDHSTLGKGMAGRMFEYINTNFRTQNSFTDQFLKFLEIENKPREKWAKQERHKQEMDKHRVINMIQSKLFKKKVDELYARTAKGYFYSDFIKAENFSEDDKWFINYLFLANGYYLNRKNYIIYRVKDDLLDYLLNIEGVTEELLIKKARELLTLNSFEEIIRSNFFYIHSFYNDPKFLTDYFKSKKEEREELASYIAENLKTKNFQCCISMKYKPGGNFTKKMLADETRVFLLTLLFIQNKDVNLSNINRVFINDFENNIAALNEELILDYLDGWKNIFNPIFIDILESEEAEMAISGDATGKIAEIGEIDEKDRPEEYIDETSEEGRLRIKEIYNARKKRARILGNYSCALEKTNNCRSIYFTAKKNGKNYVEVHHLIPREFRNDFSCSIEVLANYITLCPRCHKQIHLAIDRERKHLIDALYEERKTRLAIAGLESDLDKIQKYYKIKK